MFRHLAQDQSEYTAVSLYCPNPLQAELGDVLRVGEDVDGDDPPSLQVKPTTENGFPS